MKLTDEVSAECLASLQGIVTATVEQIMGFNEGVVHKLMFKDYSPYNGTNRLWQLINTFPLAHCKILLQLQSPIKHQV